MGVAGSADDKIGSRKTNQEAIAVGQERVDGGLVYRQWSWKKLSDARGILKNFCPLFPPPPNNPGPL